MVRGPTLQDVYMLRDLLVQTGAVTAVHLESEIHRDRKKALWARERLCSGLSAEY